MDIQLMKKALIVAVFALACCMWLITIYRKEEKDARTEKGALTVYITVTYYLAIVMACGYTAIGITLAVLW